MIALVGECVSPCSSWALSPYLLAAIVGAQVAALQVGMLVGERLPLRRGRS